MIKKTEGETKEEKVNPKDTSKPVPEETKKETITLDRDDMNARVFFTPDNSTMIISIPIAKMPRTFVRGFLMDVYDVACSWYIKRDETRLKIRENVSKFNFKDGISKLLRR